MMKGSESSTAEDPGKSSLPRKTGDREYVNHGMEDEMEVQGFIRSKMKTVVIVSLTVLTGGVLRLFLFWFPHLLVKWTHRKCQLGVANTVVLKDQYDQKFVSDVMTAMVDKEYNTITGSGRYSYKRSGSHKGSTRKDSDTIPLLFSDDELQFDVIRYFISKKVKYVWNPATETYEKLRGLEESTPCSFFHNTLGQSRAEQIKGRATYGINRIEVTITPLFQLFFQQVLSPFYVFQMFSSILWFVEWYYYYAGFIVFISVLSMTVAIYQTRTTELALRSTIESSSNVLVYRGKNVYEEISSEDLVPGDVIEIPRRGCMMQCDAVLVSGNCIVNEGMLTGESVPITKTPLPNPALSRSQEDVLFSMREHARHVLFCGTKIIQTRYYDNHKVRAVVIRTGYNTAKGELVRSIMFPKPVDFKFEVDSYKFLAFLSCIATFGVIYTFLVMSDKSAPIDEVIMLALDLVTVAVPAALPAALTIGIVFAQWRLKKNGIFCISPKRITVSGTLNVVCFDKTGTITEDGLDMKSVVPATDGKFSGEITAISTLTRSPIMAAMTTCHSLTIIDNQLCGDPMDLIMFGATKWELVEPGQEETRFDQMAPTIVKPVAAINNIYNDSFDSNFQLPVEEIGVIRQFTFSSTLQRMSVITRKLGDSHFELYMKGAPEKVITLCKSDTVPIDFHEVLTQYTRRGLRVLALAWRPLPGKLKYTKIQRIQREQVEKDLRFIGLMVMENRLKPSSSPVIHQLKEAHVRPVMVTGDNMLTALSVARECGMIDHKDNVILVQAYPAQEWSNASLEYIYTDIKDPEDLDLITLSGGRIGNIDISEKFNEVNARYHLATDGRSWAVIRKFFPDIIPKLAVKGTVFARMSPDQKAQLVEELQELEYYVGMCGDGANDCGALKTAHAGISLSEAEASVASPFTSKTANIECVPTLIREGRAALTTSFGIFKYMCMYSLVMFTTITMLYWKNANLSDFQFLFIDLVLLTTLSVTFSWTGAYSELVREPPLLKLVSISPILSVFGQTVISMSFQVFVYLNIKEQTWFVPFVENEVWDYRCEEVTALFLMSTFQYFYLSIAFSKGPPYRKSIFSNYPFMVNLVVCFAMNIWFTLYPGDGAEDFMELKPPPFLYRLILLGITIAYGFVSILFEMYVIESPYINNTLQTKLEELSRGASYRYQEVEKDIEEDSSWPPKQTNPSNLVEAFARLDGAHNTPDFDQNSLLSSLLYSSSGSYRSHSLHSTGSLRFSSGSYTVGRDEEHLIGSIGKEQDATSMGAIFPYLTKMEDITVKQFGNVEGFINALPTDPTISQNQPPYDQEFVNVDNQTRNTQSYERHLKNSDMEIDPQERTAFFIADQHVIPQIEIVKSDSKPDIVMGNVDDTVRNEDSNHLNVVTNADCDLLTKRPVGDLKESSLPADNNMSSVKIAFDKDITEQHIRTDDNNIPQPSDYLSSGTTVDVKTDVLQRQEFTQSELSIEQTNQHIDTQRETNTLSSSHTKETTELPVEQVSMPREESTMKMENTTPNNSAQETNVDYNDCKEESVASSGQESIDNENQNTLIKEVPHTEVRSSETSRTIDKQNDPACVLLATEHNSNKELDYSRHTGDDLTKPSKGSDEDLNGEDIKTDSLENNVKDIDTTHL